MKKRFRLLFVCCLAILGSAGCGNQPTLRPEAGESVHTITTDNFSSLVIDSPEPVLVDFWAPWCGPCVQIKPIVEGLAAEYEGKLVVGSVNVDDHRDLASQFDISSIPALLFFQNGKVVQREVGLVSRENLKSKIDAVLE